MSIKTNHNHTLYASYIGYITQAIVNCFAPLLFVTFSRQFSLTLDKIALITTVNFGVQLLVDLLSARLIDIMGYRTSVVAAHIFSALGLCCLAFLPDMLGYAGILISTVIYAVGGGIIEVMVSPLVEACPTEKKEAVMSLLHSFYCWGYLGVVLISTAFFKIFGIEHWRTAAVMWAVLPAANAVYFTQVPIYTVESEKETGSVKNLFKNRLFLIMMLLMVCAGASELAMSQWASAFAEKGLGVSKTAGDLAGPCMFALLMGISRVIYSKLSEKVSLITALKICSVLCVITYIATSVVKNPVINLIGCAACGFTVGVFWPGTYSLGAAKIKGGGTAMFAIMALGGDIGCVLGPGVVGFVSQSAGENLKAGLGAAIVFPALIFVGAFLLQFAEKNKTE